MKYLDRLASNISGRRTALATLSLFILTAFALNLWLVGADKRPPPWDYATYLSRSLEFYDAVKAGSLGQFISAFNEPYRPPLVPLTALPFYILFGPSYQSAMFVNLVFIAVLAFSTYKLGETLHSAQLGAITAGIVITVPGIYNLARIFNIDFPTAALVAAGTYAVIASNGFSRRNISILAGVALGLGMLIKWTCFIFLLPVVIVEITQYRKKIGVFNLFLGVMAAALITASWYVMAVEHGLVHQLLYYAYGSGAAPYSPSTSLFDVSSLLFYPSATYRYIIGPFYSVAVLVFVLFAFAMAALQSLVAAKKPSRRKRSAERKVNRSGKRAPRAVWPLAFSIIFVTVAFTLLEDKNPRFFLAVVPLAVPLLLWGGWRVHPRWGPILMIAIAVAGVSATVVGALQPAIGAKVGLYESNTISNGFNGWSEASPPKQNDWKVVQIIRIIGELNPNANVGILGNHWVYNQDTMTYYALELDFPYMQFRDFRDGQVYSPYDNLSRYDFVLVKSGDIGDAWDTKSVRPILDRLLDPNNVFYAGHASVGNFNLPDGSKLTIFMKEGNQTRIENSEAQIVNSEISLRRVRGQTRGCWLTIGKYVEPHLLQPRRQSTHLSRIARVT
jgi:4-amino-4-deoxy-L-arabinose transferase-like glycosyltransferase